MSINSSSLFYGVLVLNSNFGNFGLLSRLGGWLINPMNKGGGKAP